MTMRRGRDPLTLVRSWVAAGVWSVRGRLALRRGDVPQAVAAFEQAVSWRPGAFGPLLSLARGYLRAQETWRAHRTLAQAREADPGRFARVVPQRLAQDGVDPEMLSRLLGLTQVVTRYGSKVPTPAAATASAIVERTVEPGSLPFGDCRNLDEYARFQAMPPITEAERSSVDWDRVIDDLFVD